MAIGKGLIKFSFVTTRPLEYEFFFKDGDCLFAFDLLIYRRKFGFDAELNGQEILQLRSQLDQEIAQLDG